MVVEYHKHLHHSLVGVKQCLREQQQSTCGHKGSEVKEEEDERKEVGEWFTHQLYSPLLGNMVPSLAHIQ